MLVAPHAKSNPAHPEANPARDEQRQEWTIVHWDGRAPTDLIAKIETQLAMGAKFAVLAANSPLGREPDRALLEGWWRAIQVKLAGQCAGWAILISGADQVPRMLRRERVAAQFPEFPLRTCADRTEALRWLRDQLTRAEAATRLH